MAATAPAPPMIVIDQPGSHVPLINTTDYSQNTTQSQGTSTSPTPTASKPSTPKIDTSGNFKDQPQQTQATAKPLLTRSQSCLTTPPEEAHCYLCDEQNPGDFSPTTKFLEPCLLCSRWFCKIHQSSQFEQICNINHSTYYHDMLNAAKDVLRSRGEEVMSPVEAGTVGDMKVSGGRKLAELLISEGIFPSLGEREKAIFATSPVDESKQRELESFRSLDAALMNGGNRREKQVVEERSLVGADIAV